MKTNRISLLLLSLIVLTMAALAGCGPKKTEPAPTGVEGQLKGVMGGTPPPSAQAQIAADQNAAAAKQAAGTAAAQAAAQAAAPK